MKINFYSKNFDFNRWDPPRGAKYPAIVLYKDSWDDYSFKTSHYVRFFNSAVESEHIGFMKILHKEDKNTSLPPTFSELDVNYCSLGSIDYYYEMKKCFRNDAKNILQKLRDCAIDKNIKKKFFNYQGFRNSLLRTTNFEKALTEGKDIIEGHSPKFNSIFSFACEIGNFNNNHLISFDFGQGSDTFLPHRIFCLIGKNGTGKTQYLSKLALGMSGQNIQLKNGFTPGRPLFSRVIAISYSIYDSFKRPKAIEKSSKDYTYEDVFSYVYCGLRKSDDSILSDREIQRQLYESILKILKIGNKEEWLESLSPLFHDNGLSDLINEIEFNEKIYEIFIYDVVEIFKNEIESISQNYDIFIKNIFEKKIIDVTKFLHVSSGQGIILSCVTNIYANIREETLLIYDEPETHLHPNAIYQLISILHEILDKTNSYAIVATHSPIIIQQIPSRSVRILSQNDNDIQIEQPNLETFGENLTALTNEIFGNNMHEEYYKKILEKIATIQQRDLQIDELFEGDLSLNARIFYEGKKNEIEHN